MAKKKLTPLGRYEPFIGRTVTITFPRYKARDAGGDTKLSGRVLCIAERAGSPFGTQFDMVLQHGARFTTVALSRIVACEAHEERLDRS